MDGTDFSTKVGDLITADHKILNVENESRCGHRNALIVQDDFTNWIQSYLMKKTKGTSETMSCLQRFHLPSKKLELLYTDSKELIRFTMESRHKHPSSFRNERSGTFCRPQSESRDSYRTCAKRASRRMVGLCYGIPLLLAQRARQDG